jgi:hypothetical protein
MSGKSKSADHGTHDVATQIMERMVRLPPKPRKVAPKPTTPQGEAQRRRRENERKSKSPRDERKERPAIL